MWNGNQRGSSMISTGMTGTARQGTCLNNARVILVKTLQRAAPPWVRSPPCPDHMRGVRIVANQLQGIIGLDAGAHIEIAVLIERPATMSRLAAPKIDRNLLV